MSAVHGHGKVNQFTQSCTHFLDTRAGKGLVITLLVVGILATAAGVLSMCVLSPQLATELSALSALGALGKGGAIALIAVGGSSTVASIAALILHRKLHTSDSVVSRKQVGEAQTFIQTFTPTSTKQTKSVNVDVQGKSVSIPKYEDPAIFVALTGRLKADYYTYYISYDAAKLSDPENPRKEEVFNFLHGVKTTTGNSFVDHRKRPVSEAKSFIENNLPPEGTFISAPNLLNEPALAAQRKSYHPQPTLSTEEALSSTDKHNPSGETTGQPT